MINKVRNSLVFQLEQVVTRGPIWRFGLMLALVVAVAVAGGVLARLAAPGFESIGDAVWWAFLRLTDPGYLGEDEGLAKGALSIVVTLLGFVLFTGALIAILVQWFDKTMERLELGLTPVALESHFVVTGWTSRSPLILEEILASQGRVERFLRRKGVKRLRIVVLTESADGGLREQIRLQLGSRWNAAQIILRSGSPLNLDDLERVDFAHAGAILVPSFDTTAGSLLDADTRTVKTLMTMGAALDGAPAGEQPLVVVEVQEMRHAETLRALYSGPMEIIAAAELISGMVVQNLRHPGLSHVYAEFLSDTQGSQIYVRDEPQLVGASVRELAYAFPEGVFLGLVRPEGEAFRALLTLPGDFRVEKGDRVAVLAPSYEDAAPPETLRPAPELPTRPTPGPGSPRQRRILILGWNHRVPSLLREFASYPGESFTIDIVSQVQPSKREKRVGYALGTTGRLEITQLEFDYTVPADLERLDPSSYDNLLLLSSERLKAGSESDARTILGYLLLRKMLEGAESPPPVLVELTDPDNAALFENRAGEVIVSPVIVSLMLARVGLRRELRAVFDELFTSGGSEIFFRRLSDYGLDEGAYSFDRLRRAVHAAGEIAIGYRQLSDEPQAGGGVHLNPRHGEPVSLVADDELIVLVTRA